MNAKYWLFSLLFLVKIVCFGQTVPPAPTGLRVTATECGKVSLAWDEYPAGITINKFQINRYNSESGSNGIIGSVNGTTFQFDDFGTIGSFNSGENYSYTINALAQSQTSNASTAVTAKITGCPKIDNLKVGNSTCGAITLNWSAISGATGYSIYRSVTGENGYYSYYDAVTQNSYADIGNHQLNGVASGVTYYYKIKAKIGNVITEYSNIVSASFICQAPTGLKITKASCGAIELAWDDYPPELLEDGFSIQRAYEPNGTFNNIGWVPKNITSFTDKDFSFIEGQTYYYKISGFFQSSEIQSQMVVSGSFTCDIPTGLKVTKAECGEITLAWNDYPIGVNETGYDIVRQDSYGSTYTVASVNANVLSYTITNNNYSEFSPGKTYYYKIAGKFNNKTTRYTEPVSASFTCPTPSNLKITSTTCFNVSLNWDDIPVPYSETGYIVMRANNGYYSQIGEVNANILSFNDTFYKNSGETYSYKIIAKFNGTQSDPSNIVSTLIQCVVPSDLEVTSATCGEINLKWKNNYSGPILVIVFRSDNGENGNYQQIKYYQQNLNTYTDKGELYTPLIEGKTYYYKVQVVKNNTTTEYSNVASGTFTCTAPANLAISASSCGEFTLNWPDYPAGTNETGYIILRSTNNDQNSFAYLTELPANTLSYTDNTVYNYYFTDYKFYYRIIGKFNNTSTKPSKIVTTNYTCPIIQNLKVVSTNCGQINLTWDALPTNFNVNKYIIYRSQNGVTGYALRGEVVGNVNNYIDTDYLELGSTYFYKIKAIINNVETDFGNEVSANFTCQAPQNLQITSTSCGIINLAWADYPNNINESGYVVYRYDPNSYNNYQEIANLPANTLSFTDYGSLTAGIPQTYKIKGKFAGTFTDFSLPVSGSCTCIAPTNLRASSSNCGTIILNWDDYPSTFSENRFQIFRSDNGIAGQYYAIGSVAANVLTYADISYSGFIPGKNYYYQIRGVYLNTTTEPSNTVEIQTICLPPSNAIFKSAICGEITIGWDDYPAGTNETGYKVLKNYNNIGGFSTIATLPANTTTFTDKNSGNSELLTGVKYKYKIVGIFGNTQTAEIEQIEASFTCEIPQNLRLKSANCGAISLQWDDLPSSVSETGYQIYRASNSGGETLVGTVAANVLTFVDYNSLSPNTIYKYTVKAIINNTKSNASNMVSASFSCPVPTNLEVVEMKCNEIGLKWSNGLVASGGYEIYRADDGFNYFLAGAVPFGIYNFTDTGTSRNFQAGINYTYKIKAKILSTRTDFSNAVAATFSCEQPTNLKISSTSCGQLTLNWDDFAGLNETGFEIFRSDVGINGSYNSIGTVNANTLAFIDRGNNQSFFSGKEYFYKIKGKSNNNSTDFSNAVSAKFNCSVPQNLIVKEASCGKIELSWDSYAGSNVVQIFRSEIGESGPFNLSFDSYQTTNNYIDNGSQGALALNKTYYYKIRLKTNNIITDFSNIVSGSFNCEIPQNLIVTNSNCGEINLKWDDYPPNLSEGGYYIYRSQNNINGEYRLVGNTSANVLIFSDKGQSGDALFAGTTYYYKIKGRFNSSESFFSNIASSSFQCDIPQNLKAISNTCGSIKISWDKIPNATRYNIYRSEYEFGNFSNVGIVYSNIAEYEDTYFQKNAKYYYKISAGFSTNSYSELSASTAAQLICPIPQNLKITEINCGSVKLSWDDLPSDNLETGYFIYRIEKNKAGAVWNRVGSVAANVLSYIDAGIYGGFDLASTYNYKIAASFGNSITDYSNEVTAKFDCPTTTTAILSSTSCGKITINWNSISSEKITSYTIMRATSLLDNDFKYRENVNATVNTFEDTDSYFESGKTYYYKIVPLIGSNTTTPSNIVSASFTCGASPILKITSSECGKVSLSWTDYPENLSETNFEVSRSENGIDFNYIGRVNPNTFTFDDVGYIRPLQSGIKYYYRVKGYNYLVIFDGSNIETTKLDCYLVPVLSLENTSCGKVNLAWQDPNDTNEDNYIIYRANIADENYYQIGQVLANVSKYSDASYLEAGMQYKYKIAAKFGNNLSPFSNIIVAQFNCENNLLLAATATSCNTIKLNWNADSKQGQSNFYYMIYRSEMSIDGLYKEISYSSNNSFIDQTNVLPNKIYYYKIKTYNNGLTSDFSLASSVEVICSNSAQSPPANFQSTAQSCSEITLNWDDFAEGTVEESFEIHRSLDGLNYSLIASPAANSISYVDKNLAQNTTYYYRIRGRFSAGFSDFTAAISPKTQCVAVTNFAISSISCTSISLSWSDLGGINTEESYELHRSTDGITYSLLANIDANSTQYLDKNLALNTTYFYQIRGRFGSGFTPFSPAISAKTECPGITNFMVGSATCTSISLSWSDLGGVNTEESYELHRSTDGITYSLLANIDANSTEYLDKNLALNTAYFYQIRGRFGSGFTPFSPAISAKTTCQGPTNFVAIPQNCTQILLTWNDLGATNIEESYELYRSTTGLANSYEFVSKIDANSTQYLDQSLQTNASYWYLLRGRFGTGFSPYSATVESKTSSVTLLLVAKSSSSATLRWNICSSDREDWAIFMSSNGINATEIGRADALIDTYKVENLVAGQTYYFWVSPTLRTGYGNLSNMVTVQIPAFPKPTNFIAKPISSTEINLIWQDNSNGPDHEESWELMMQTIDNKWIIIDKIDANKTNFVLDSLKADTTYCLAVRARHGMGFSEISNVQCAKTLKPAVQSIAKSADVLKKSTRQSADNSEIIGDFEYKIYPNPANKYLILKLNENQKTEISLSIINSSGQIFKTEQLKPNSNNYEISIDKIPNGLYFLKIKDGFTEKMLKFLKWE